MGRARGASRKGLGQGRAQRSGPRPGEIRRGRASARGIGHVRAVPSHIGYPTPARCRDPGQGVDGHGGHVTTPAAFEGRRRTHRDGATVTIGSLVDAHGQARWHATTFYANTFTARSTLCITGCSAPTAAHIAPEARPGSQRIDRARSTSSPCSAQPTRTERSSRHSLQPTRAPTRP